MDTTTAAVAHRVDAARRAQGVAVLPLSDATGIPRTTLTRQLAGLAEFKVSDLMRISRHLNVNAADMLPPRDNTAEAAA